MIKSSDLFKRSGVALADILANSVAVILILLIATLDIEQKRVQDEIKENASITTILSRQIASNIVFNDLPTSPPAYLHDYHQCSIKHDCEPMLYPIIEIYDDYARIIGKEVVNQKLYRNELLKQKNALDRYLDSLSPTDLANIRLDIRGVGQYYLILSILSEHKIHPRHWHYLGEYEPPLNTTQLATEESFGQPESLLNKFDDKQTEKPHQNTGSSSNSSDDVGKEWHQETEIEKLLGDKIGQLSLNSQQYDSLLPADGASNEQKEFMSDQGFDADKFTKLQQLIGVSESDLLKLIDIGTGSNGSNNNSDSYQSRMYIPNLKTDLLSPAMNSSEGGSPLELEKYRPLMLANLFNILTYAKSEQTFDLSNQAKAQLKFAMQTVNIKQHPYYAIIKQLNTELSTKNVLKNSLNHISYRPELANNQLIITANQAIPDIELALLKNEDWIKRLKNRPKLNIDYLLRLYPTLFKGEFLKSSDNMTVLVLPEEFNNPHPRWIPIVAFDYRLENISLGFIYAGMDNHQLIVDANINQVKLNNRYISKIKVNQSQHNDYGYSSMMWLVVLVLIILLLAKPWIKQSKYLNS